MDRALRRAGQNPVAQPADPAAALLGREVTKRPGETLKSGPPLGRLRVQQSLIEISLHKAKFPLAQQFRHFPAVIKAEAGPTRITLETAQMTRVHVFGVISRLAGK